MKFLGKIFFLLFVILVPGISTKDQMKKSPGIYLNPYAYFHDRNIIVHIIEEQQKQLELALKLEMEMELEVKNLQWSKNSSKKLTELDQEYYLRYM